MKPTRRILIAKRGWYTSRKKPMALAKTTSLSLTILFMGWDRRLRPLVCFSSPLNAVRNLIAISPRTGIEGIEENACFMKEVEDAQKLRKLVMSRVEEASLKGQFEENIDRLLHMVVVGGGPTGVEVAAELQDYFKGDLQKLVPELKGKLKVTLIEALPTVWLKDSSLPWIRRAHIFSRFFRYSQSN